MTKPDLRQAMSTEAKGPAAKKMAVGRKIVAASPRLQPSRVGTRQIAAHFPPAVHKQVKLLAAQQDTTIQDLLGEALNDLFAKYRKPEIAPRRE